MHCADCKFAMIENNQGACVRYPPQVVMVKMQTLQGIAEVPAAVFPPIKPDNYCGEWTATSESALLVD